MIKPDGLVVSISFRILYKLSFNYKYRSNISGFFLKFWSIRSRISKKWRNVLRNTSRMLKMATFQNYNNILTTYILLYQIYDKFTILMSEQPFIILVPSMYSHHHLKMIWIYDDRYIMMDIWWWYVYQDKSTKLSCVNPDKIIEG